MIKPRYYQEDAIAAIFNYFSNGGIGNPLLALPTGTGKSIIISEFITRVLKAWPNQRIIKVTHRKELLEQNAEKLLTNWPAAPLGFFSAGLKKKQSGHPIVFAGIQSVSKFLKKNPKGFGIRNLMLVDECHLISPKKETQYQSVIKTLKELNPHLKVIGFTATPYRMKSGCMVEDEDGIFTDLIYDLCSMNSFNRLLDEGYLAPLIPKRTELRIDVTGVKKTGGDYNKKELEAKVNTEEVNYKVVEELVKHGYDRKSWLIFASGVNHAENIKDLLGCFGISAETVHSKKKDKENRRALSDFKAGKIRCLVNNNVLTTGFDHPDIDLIGIARPTRSVSLWVQMLGRGTRPAPGKKNCLVMDFAGNTELLGPINDPVKPIKRQKGVRSGEAPIKVCEVCFTYCHTTVRVCPLCGTPFPTREKLKRTASTAELIRKPETVLDMLKKVDKAVINKYPVTNISFQTHRKRGSNDMMKVTYQCGIMGAFKEYICFDHTGFARGMAEDWWLRMTGGRTPPPTTSLAVTHAKDYVRIPKAISVKQLESGEGYPDIIGVTF